MNFIRDAIHDAGMNAWSHYTRFGTYEGIYLTGLSAEYVEREENQRRIEESRRLYEEYLEKLRLEKEKAMEERKKAKEQF